jgi:hypothetical protein
MLLRVAGINHFDPLGRQKLNDWLAQYAHEEPGPAFLATGKTVWIPHASGRKNRGLFWQSYQAITYRVPNVGRLARYRLLWPDDAINH